jgi:hypothetical protein
MPEYDLAVVGILWGTAIAFALSAITMVDSGRKRLLVWLWTIAFLQQHQPLRPMDGHRRPIPAQTLLPLLFCRTP